MGFLDDAKKRLGDAVDKHGEKISDGLDRAARTLDEKTDGKHRDKIHGGVDKIKDTLEDLDGKKDDLPSSTSTPTSKPTEPTEAAEAPTPADPMGAAEGGGDPHPVPTDPSPVPPEPGADPNEDIASGVRPGASGGPTG